MFYIQPTPNPSGAYPSPQSDFVEGLLELPDELLGDFINYNGFVKLTVESNKVTAVNVNKEAWENWKSSVVEPEVVPDAQTDMDELLIDLAYRVTLLELGAKV